jgi:hypothetical protein
MEKIEKVFARLVEQNELRKQALVLEFNRLLIELKVHEIADIKEREKEERDILERMNPSIVENVNGMLDFLSEDKEFNELMSDSFTKKLMLSRLKEFATKGV